MAANYPKDATYTDTGRQATSSIWCTTYPQPEKDSPVTSNWPFGKLRGISVIQTRLFYVTKYTRSPVFVGGNYWLEFYSIIFTLVSLNIFWIKNEGVFNRRKEVHAILLLN